jgi:DNA-binding transcriptional LysR family regulator
MRFDLTDLRLFLHVVEAESITHGAERANLALASASARIRGMEETSGVALLERNPRGVRPTPAGVALAHHSRVVLGQLEQMRGDLRNYAQGLRGHVRVLSNTGALTHLPAALARFLIAYPAIDVDLEERPSHEVVAAVSGGLADVGLAANMIDTGPLETLPFETDRLVVVVPQDHALAARDAVTFREVLNEPLIGLSYGSPLQANLAHHAAREGRPFKLRVRLGSFEAICNMVESGVGLTIVPESAARKHRDPIALRSLALSEPWALRHLVICVRSLSGLTAHAQQLVGFLTNGRTQQGHRAAEPGYLEVR